MIDRAALRAATRYEDGRLYWVSHPSRPSLNGRQVGGNTPSNCGYLRASVMGSQHDIHKLVWAWHYDEDPKIINHINENKLDNRIENLQASSHRHNRLYSLPERDLPSNIYRTHSGNYIAIRYIGGKRYTSKVSTTVLGAVNLLNQLEATWQA